MFRWLFLLAVLTVAGVAFGAVKREGTWPEQDKPITVDLTNVTRAEAVRKVAEAAGWSIVFKGLPEDRIDLHVKSQPAARVLDLVLSDAGYVAKREGDLIQIQRDDGPSQDTHAAPPPPVVSAPAAEPAPTTSAPTHSKKKHNKHREDDSNKDRTVFGGSVRVEPNEVVDDITVFGGTVDILGKATGDVTVFGGSVHVHPGAHVDEDVTVIGGEVTIDDDATIDGDVAALGGDLHRGSGAKIGGEVKQLGDDEEHEERPSKGSAARSVLRSIGIQLTKTAFLFLLGAIVIALATRRMQLLQSEIALRPMRSLAIGGAAITVSIILTVLLCVTVVGIPVALAVIFIGILATYAGICAVLSVMGSALVAHRSENPYVHLAVGCGVFLVAGSIPYFGSLVTLLITLAGVGAFAATRGAGFLPAQR
jgi:cytoskeletal protein CcmA (bactofilin family)